MPGVTFTLRIEGVDAVLARLDALGRVEFHELTEGLGALGVSQTQTRIEEEKTAPDGRAWATTRDGRAALFVTGAHLYNSIQYDADAERATWGSGWIGAGVHQHGATIVPVNGKALAFRAGGKDVFARSVTIPARPFVGLSADNAAEMEETAALFVRRHLQ